MRWKAFMESMRRSVQEIEVLTLRIANGGRDWSPSGPKVYVPSTSSPTESAAIANLTEVVKLEQQRDEHVARVGRALAAIQSVRNGLGKVEGDILELFYIDGFLSGEIAGELGITVDSVFYRKRRTLAWMDENLPMVE
jgi:DNA-directed RNA polymerase specialized sigma24 family protein